jgi:glutathione S-transferase
MLKVWGRRNSLNVQKVLWLVGELGLEHEHIPAGGDHGRLDEADFRRMNPHGLVPVLQDDGVSVWESHSILRYLAERYGGTAFWPDLAQRARIEPWLDWAQTSFQPSFSTGLFWGYFRTPEDRRDWPAIRRNMETCARELQRVDELLEKREFLAGETFTLADIPLGACLFRYFGMGLERPALPNVERWYGRLCARPAYVDHVMLPFEDLRGRLAF